jgi:small subunit ribosomal protein S4
MRGLTGENLFKLLELRLDNVVYRMGFAASRKFARQLVGHGKVTVNDRKINLPGYQMKPGDKVVLQAKMKENTMIKRSMEFITSLPSWLSIDKQKAEGTVVSIPMPEVFSHPLESQLIVELYSK